MEALSVLSSNGAHRVAFGGDRSFKTLNWRDYIVSLEWFGPSGREVDACMVIYNARRDSNDAGAWIIGRRQIAKYTDGNNNPTPYCFTEAAEALVVLGRSTIDMELLHLVSCVMAHVDDLVKMPPAPVAVKSRAGHHPGARSRSPGTPGSGSGCPQSP